VGPKKGPPPIFARSASPSAAQLYFNRLHRGCRGATRLVSLRSEKFQHAEAICLAYAPGHRLWSRAVGPATASRRASRFSSHCAGACSRESAFPPATSRGVGPIRAVITPLAERPRGRPTRLGKREIGRRLLLVRRNETEAFRFAGLEARGPMAPQGTARLQAREAPGAHGDTQRRRRGPLGAVPRGSGLSCALPRPAAACARRPFHFPCSFFMVQAPLPQQGTGPPVKIFPALALAFSLVTPAFAVDPTGVPQCDALLQRYEACASTLPGERAHAARREVADGATSIRAAGNDPKLRSDLERYCADTFARMKTEGDIKECMAQ
jgi:hypothetical protein